MYSCRFPRTRGIASHALFVFNSLTSRVIVSIFSSPTKWSRLKILCNMILMTRKATTIAIQRMKTTRARSRSVEMALSATWMVYLARCTRVHTNNPKRYDQLLLIICTNWIAICQSEQYRPLTFNHIVKTNDLQVWRGTLVTTVLHRSLSFLRDCTMPLLGEWTVCLVVHIFVYTDTKRPMQDLVLFMPSKLPSNPGFCEM